MTPLERAERILELVRHGGPPDQLRAAVAGEVRAAIEAQARSEDATADAAARRRDLERAREALRESRHLQERILETVPGGIVVVSPTGAVLQANPEATRLLGLSYDELTRRYISDFGTVTYREDGSECAVEEYPVARCLATQQPQPPMIIGVGRPGGDVSWAVFTAVPLVEPGSDRFLGVVVTFLDVTERKRTEEELRRSEGRFRALVQNSPDHIVLLDREARVRYLNHLAPGWSAEELIGQSVLDTAAADERERLAEAIHSGLEGRVATLESTDNRGRHYVTRVVPLHDEPEGAAAMLIASDVTERVAMERHRRELESRVQEAQRLESLGVLAGGIAHDFSNLLVGILGNAELAAREAPPGSRLGELLRDVRAAAGHASDLTRQLLAYSGKGQLVVAPLDLNALVREMVHLLGASISKKARLELDLLPDLPGIDADATQVRQVVMNLITNASEALGKAPGRIAVRTRLVERDLVVADVPPLRQPELPAERYVVLEVEDDGAGMDEATRERIFDPFFTTKFTGRGLGLAAVQGIVRGHGGAATVWSRPGEGSRFRLYFPSLDRPAASPEAVSSAPAEAPPGGTVLIIDDEHHVRSVARLVLQEAGYRVFTARNGREGVETFAAHADEVDLVLLDLLMPDMDGDEALAELRRLRPEVPVILSSGYGEQGASEALRSCGLAGFLHKPWPIDRLLEVVGDAVRRSADG